MALLIKGATLLSGKKSDILIEGNIITKIAPSISASADKIDAKGKLAIPGFVNSHMHAGMTLLRGICEDRKLSDWLSHVWKAEGKMAEKQIGAGSALSCLEMIKSGTTCFSDMYFHMDGVASAVEKSGMRAVLGYGMIDGGNRKGTRESADEKKMEKELTIGERFVKDWHGKADGRITCSIAPHALYTCSAPLLERSAALSEKYKIPLHIHLSETRREVFDCLSENGKRPAYHLDSLGILSPRTVAAHCVWLTKEEVRLLASRGVSSSLCPVSNMKLASGGVAPMPEMLGFRMNVSLGTDGAASNNSLSMLETMKFCSLLQKNARWDATVGKEEEVFSAATAGGAKAYGLNCGELAEGKLADIALIGMRSANMSPRHDLLSNLVFSAHEGNVADCIIGGRLVMENRRVLSMDEEKVIEEAQKAAEKLY
ncbi:MAG: amidohydrolase [Candidatus Micrarchaeia archaeon]